MKSPPNSPPSRGERGETRGRSHNIKPIGSGHSTKSGQSSGASQSFGGIIRGNAVGNTPNIGDFESMEVTSEPVEITLMASVNLWHSEKPPTTLEIDQNSIIGVEIPYVDTLAPLLQHVARCCSPLQSKSLNVK